MSEYREGARGPCDRCGEPVRKSEDCTLWEETLHRLMFGKATFAGFTRARHLRCSPSRWQYLGGPRTPTYDPATALYAGPAAEVLREAARSFDPEREDFGDRVRDLCEEAARERRRMTEGNGHDWLCGWEAARAGRSTLPPRFLSLSASAAVRGGWFNRGWRAYHDVLASEPCHVAAWRGSYRHGGEQQGAP